MFFHALRHFVNMLLSQDQVCLNSQMILSFVKVEGTQYRPGNCLLLQLNGEDPVLAQIKHILFVNSQMEPLTVGELLSMKCYHSHFHSYEVTFTHSTTVLKLHDIADHHVLSLNQVYNAPNTFFYYFEVLRTKCI